MWLSLSSLRLNEKRFSRAEVYAVKTTLLGFCINDVWVFRICSRLMSVCK
jgi:hypothetical protein